MLKEERQAYIVRQVNLHNKVLSVDLSNTIGVSEDTIRRDLNELADCGKLIKVYGGALSIGFNQVTFDSKHVYALDAKRIIAQKAQNLLKNGMIIHLTGGTTILEMVKILPHTLKATFMTGSIPVISELVKVQNSEIILVGDRISKESKLAVGSSAVKEIEQVYADLGFIGTNALDIERGITDSDWDVVQVKRAIVHSCRKTVCMVISEKIPSHQSIKVCGIDKLDYLITELDPEHEKLKAFKESGVVIL